MPINNDLPDIKLPVSFKKNKEPWTNFVSHLEAIDVKLLNAPPMEDLLEYIPRWGTATWVDKPHNTFTDEERKEVVQDMFDGNILPSALETVGLTFLISNIDLVDVTHLLRHRTMSFSAICTADRDQRFDDCLVKPSIEMSSEFFSRYVSITAQAKQLYADMVDSDEVSILDARTILPRCLENHYYCRVNLKDVIHYIMQRIDRQIQPESDNIVALKMWIEIVKRYPMAKDMININAPDMWYIKTAPTSRGSNIYMPEKPRNDIFEHKPQWFLYKKQRSEMRGGYKFVNLWNKLVEELNAL